MCNACGFQCCGSDELDGCGCDSCGNIDCLRLCEDCGQEESECTCHENPFGEESTENSDEDSFK